MRSPDIPENEQDRQAAIDSLDLVYSPPEERFERITRIAKRVFDVPIALISIVSNDIQWFKSRQGLTEPETSREVSFCGHAILRDHTFVVPNASHDPDFQDNPLVTGPPNIRFYAGQPLLFDGHRIGTLCIIDTRPRQFKPKDYDSMKCLAAWVELELKSNEDSESIHTKLPSRKELLNSVTGDFNREGLKTLQKIWAQDNQSSELPKSITLDLRKENKIQFPAESLKEISSVIHSVIVDEGIVGFNPEFGFSIFLNSPGDSKAADLLELLSDNLNTSGLITNSAAMLQIEDSN